MRKLRPGGRDLQIGLHIHSVCELLIDLPIALYAALIGEDGDGARSMIRRIIRDEQGGVIIENTITMLVFVLLTMGITQAGLIMWSAVGLEHGVEMAARCASVSDAAIDAGFVPSTTTPTPCYSTSTKRAANNQSTVKAYAVSESWGVGVPSSAFTVSSGSSGACASPYNKVSSSYSETLMNYLFSPHLSPLSCYATN
jgi:Flp pilus assembly protein TadG